MDPSRWMTLGRALALVICLAEAASSAAGEAPPERRLPRGARVDRLIAYKGAHRLEAYAGDRLLATYRIAIGAGGEGPKRWEGDRRTPEGVYRIDRRHQSRRYHRFLHVSYPNDEDRRRYEALRARGEVPEGKGIGGDIGVHGEARGEELRRLDVTRDWTEGCIAVSDGEIEALYEAVVRDAVIEIRP